MNDFEYSSEGLALTRTFEGLRLAARVTEYRGLFPDRRLYLIGHSTGCAVVLAAAERLPPDGVDRIVLLSPSVSAAWSFSVARFAMKRSCSTAVRSAAAPSFSFARSASSASMSCSAAVISRHGSSTRDGTICTGRAIPRLKKLARRFGCRINIFTAQSRSKATSREP